MSGVALLIAAILVLVPVGVVDAGSDGDHDHGDHDQSDHGQGELGPTGAPDAPVRGPQGGVGQFVVECGFSHGAVADPILHPGEAGAGHLHHFFGSEVTAAGSTYEELTAAPTSCQHAHDTAAYWAPALLSDGEPVTPWRAVAYYRAGPGVEPASVQPYPPGLKLVAGDAGAAAPQSAAVVGWTCNAGADRLAAPPSCPDGSTLRLIVTFPDCWDGANTDSVDHRAHAAYSTAGACPPGHPVPIPQLQFAVDYPAQHPATLSLSSGDLVGAHADFWNTWDQDALTREVAACLQRDVVCNVSS